MHELMFLQLQKDRHRTTVHEVERERLATASRAWGPAKTPVRMGEAGMNVLVAKPFWLLVKVEAGRIYIMTTGLATGGTALPVFSFEEEAAMFRDLGAPHVGWRVEQTVDTGLVSVLQRPCADVDMVLLDPLPGVDAGTSADLVGVGREPFLEFLSRTAGERSR